MPTDDYFLRSRALLGAAGMARLEGLRVLLVGVGGVGSWAAEALVRTGVSHLTLMDPDRVEASNVNRQLQALPASVGEMKVEALRRRLLAVNPSARVVALGARYAGGLDLSPYTHVVDAIDDLPAKVLLIRAALASGATLLSAMGAARKTDPTRVRLAPFSRVQGCPLARALRQRFRREGGLPDDFLCAFSDEPPRPGAEKGSLMPVTAAFGLALAAAVCEPR